MGIATATRDITAFARMNMVRKTVDAQVGLMTGKPPLQQTSGSEIAMTNIATCRNAKVKVGVGNVISAKANFTVAGTYLGILRDKLDAMVQVLEMAASQDLINGDAEMSGLSAQYTAYAASITVDLTGGAATGFQIKGSAGALVDVWSAAYALAVPIDGTPVTFALPQLDVATGGNFSMAAGVGPDLTFIGTVTKAAALADIIIIKGYLGVIGAQESTVAGVLAKLDGHIASLQQKIGQNSAVIDEMRTYDIDRASDFMGDVLSEAQGSAFVQMLDASIRDIQKQVAMRLLAS